MQPREDVVAIIPAFNEEETIAGVVSVLVDSPFIHDVIVVSDGSTDRTGAVASEHGAIVIELEENKGKGNAMLAGVSHTNASIIAFFDADLIGLTQAHVESLILPVANGAMAMSVGLRDRGEVVSIWTKYLPLIGGERVLRREIIERIDPKYLEGFMVESALNYYCRMNKLSYGTVFLENLNIRRKYEKVGWQEGVIQYLQMTLQIIKAILTVRMAKLLHKFPSS